MSETKERLLALDLARGLAICFMIMVHVLEWHSISSIRTSILGEVIEFLGGPPAAPVFAFLMGVSLFLSRHADLHKALVRGARLLGLAYILNCLRGTLPLWLGLHWEVFSQDELGVFTPLSVLWLVDILQFAGLALMVLAVVRHFKAPPRLYIILAGLVALVAPLVWGLKSGNGLVDGVLTLLWGDNGELVAFPLFPWLCYPLVGAGFGQWLVNTDDRPSLFRRALRIGIALLILGTGIIALDVEHQLGDYWRHRLGTVLWLCGFVLVWLAFCHWLVAWLPPNALFRLLYRWSAHVTVFYVIHWVVLGWSLLVFGFQKQGWGITLLMMLGTALLAHSGTEWWYHVRAPNKGVNPTALTRV